MAQLDFPNSPTPGQVYAGTNGVNYTYTLVNGLYVWLAEAASPVPALTLTPGTITGTAEVGATLTFAPGTASGGVTPYGAVTWIWKKASDNSPLQTGGTYVIPAGLLGDRVYVDSSVTDAAATIATATTANYPAAPNVINPAGITGAVMPTTIPGTANFTYTNTTGSLSATGCVEFSTDGGGTWTQAATPVTSGVTTVTTRWVDVASSGLCGDAPHNTNISGTLTNGTQTTTFNLTIDRLPDAFVLSPNTETTTPNTVTAADPTFTLSGSNAPSYIWGSFGSTGGTPEYTTDAGTTWNAIPAAPGTATVNPGATVSIRFTTGAANGTETFTVNVGVDAATKESGTFTVTVASTPFASTFTPSYAPNASPATVNEGAAFFGPSGIAGTATTTNWVDPAIAVTTTNMLLSIGAGVAPTLSTVTPAAGNTVNVAWDPTYIGTLAHNGTATGSITNGSNTNSYTFTVDQDAFFTVPADTGTGSAGSSITIPVQTPNDFNVPIDLYGVGGANPMVTPTVSINGGAAVALPTAAGTLTLNPGDTVAFFADLGPLVGPSTVYSLTIHMGVASQTWSQTVDTAPAVAQPAITGPTGSALEPQYNSPGGLTLITPATGAGSFQPSGGAGTDHASSNWEVYENAYPLTSTATVSALNAGTAGTIGTIQYKTTGGADPNPSLAQNVVYGKIAQDNALTAGVAAGGTYPLFAWADALTLNGYSDWYIPAKNELEILYYNLKPSTPTGPFSNNTSSGINPNAVPARATNYVNTGPPIQTTASSFQFGGSQAFSSSSTLLFYWSSSEDSGSTGNARIGGFGTGNQGVALKFDTHYARAIRRIPIADYTAAGSPAIGSYLAGGYYGGQISTAGNGTADYALIVAPKVGGEYESTPGTDPSLSIAGANTDGFEVGWKIKGDTSGAVAVITAINGTTVSYLPISGTFQTGETISADSTSPGGYSQIVPPPGNPNTTDLVSLFLPIANLSPSTRYYARVQFTSGTAGGGVVTTSPWSTWAGFATASSFALVPGAPMAGGYFAGQISTAGNGIADYNLIVAPVTSGGLNGQYGGATPAGIQWKTSPSGPDPTAQSQVYGATAMLANNTNTWPMFDWCKNNLTGPNRGNYDATNTAGDGIGGYNDWYIPARNELEIVYRNLKPTTNANNTSFGANANAVPSATGNYTAGDPAQTVADGNNGTANFRTGGAQAFSTANFYWSASEISSNTGYAWNLFFNNGGQDFFTSVKTDAYYARAIRRIPV